MVDLAVVWIVGMLAAIPALVWFARDLAGIHGPSWYWTGHHRAGWQWAVLIGWTFLEYAPYQQTRSDRPLRGTRLS